MTATIPGTPPKNPSAHPPILPIVVLVGLALLVAVLAVRIWQQSRASRTLDGNTRAALLRVPESHLYYPGAVVLGETGNDPYRFLGGTAAASTGAFLGVDASQEEVFAYYTTQLAATGWIYTPQRIALTSLETAGRTWRRGEHEVFVNIVRNSQLDSRLPAGVTDHRTVYRLRLVYVGPPLPTPVP